MTITDEQKEILKAFEEWWYKTEWLIRKKGVKDRLDCFLTVNWFLADLTPEDGAEKYYQLTRMEGSTPRPDPDADPNLFFPEEGYRVPLIIEFGPGFKFEIKLDGQWKEVECLTKNVDSFEYYLKKGEIRVKKNLPAVGSTVSLDLGQIGPSELKVVRYDGDKVYLKHWNGHEIDLTINQLLKDI